MTTYAFHPMGHGIDIFPPSRPLSGWGGKPPPKKSLWQRIKPYIIPTIVAAAFVCAASHWLGETRAFGADSQMWLKPGEKVKMETIVFCRNVKDALNIIAIEKDKGHLKAQDELEKYKQLDSDGVVSACFEGTVRVRVAREITSFTSIETGFGSNIWHLLAVDSLVIFQALDPKLPRAPVKIVKEYKRVLFAFCPIGVGQGT